MSLPENTVSVFPVPGVFEPPDGKRGQQLEDFEAGGVAVQNTSEGLSAYEWRCWVDGIDVKLQRVGAAEQTVFQQADIAEIALAFDQNMRPSIAYTTVTGSLYLRWYDSVIQQYTTTSFGTARNPRLSLDDKRPENSSGSDIIFAYIRGTTLYWRQQRDRYQTEYVAATNIGAKTSLLDIGLTKTLRFQFQIG